MTRLLAALLAALVMLVSTAQAQELAWGQIIPESAFLRADPLPDAERIASVFEGDSLIAVGRNADATWFEVQRPGGRSTGWISADLLRETFRAWDVPITSNAGIEGEPVLDTGLDAFILANAVLRGEPFISGTPILTIPHSVTLPIVGRNQDASWLRVNYNGTIGWVSETVIEPSGNLMSAPLSLDLPPLAVNVIIIPPEVQLAQVERVRAFAREQIDLSLGLSNYWQLLLRGEILPCTPPSFITTLQRTPSDIQQLPELQRWLPRLDDSIEAINNSMEPLQSCGAYTPEIINKARADAINARLMLENILVQLRDVENIINRSR
jgi:hypothetical protein